MSKIAFSVTTARDAARQLTLNVLSPEPGKSHYRGFLNEKIGGVALPGHAVTLFLNEAGGKRWFTISAPIRQQNQDGSFVFQLRTNETGQYLDDRGNVAASPEQAARQFAYLQSTRGEVVYGTFGSLNIKNTKADGVTPTKMTLASLKLFSDAESLEMERFRWTLKTKEKGSPEYDQLVQHIDTLSREYGEWQNCFIESGGDYLRGMGFEVRSNDRQQAAGYTPGR